VIQIDSSKVKGEPGTGYEPPDGRGPFQCSNCHYFQKVDSSCGQVTMRKVSKLRRTADGFVMVDPAGCCEYVERKASEKRDAFKQAHQARGAK
jgi:hypothetical protein